MDNKTDEILGNLFLETPWGIHQTNGIYRRDYFVYGGLVIEPLGYFDSEPLGEDEMDSYNENKERFFENQIAEETDDERSIPGYTTVILLIGILVSVIIKKRNRSMKS
ncbi:MAG: hypothetical protein ACLFSM_09290, partial [Thermoplasmata archaeon]